MLLDILYIMVNYKERIKKNKKSTPESMRGSRVLQSQNAGGGGEHFDVSGRLKSASSALCDLRGHGGNFGTH